MIRHLPKSIPAAALALLLVACAAAPEQIDELEQARAAVQALAQAERALEERRPRERVVHLAYLAQRQAQIGQARLAETTAREQIASAEAARNRVLLEARRQPLPRRRSRKPSEPARRRTDCAIASRK
jgi:hypothetical protein